MKVGIMQPYFLPYIGYFQLIASVDLFIVYDNIKYTKKGWINRNRMLQNGKDVVFSLPLKKDSDALDVIQRNLAADFKRDKLLSAWKEAYSRAPYFEPTFALLERIVRHPEQNLFRFIHHAIEQTCAYLGIETKIQISSSIAVDHMLKSEDKVLAICQAVGANVYVNPIGGMDLYSKDTFQQHAIALKFIRSNDFEYPQLGNTFVPWLSIVDVLMFNALPDIRRQIHMGFHFI